MMHVFRVEVRSSFIDDPLITSFHSNMFHGLAERDGMESPHNPPVWAYTEAPSPLEISRTGHGVPDVCCPSGDLVVCERLAERLRSVPHIRLQRVAFKRLVDVPYAKGDDSWEVWSKRFGGHDPCRLLRTMPDVADFHKSIGAYFEVQTWRTQDLVEQYEPCKDVAADSHTMGRVIIRVSERMLREYPIIWSMGGTLLADGAFQILDESIDRDYFIVREFNV